MGTVDVIEFCLWLIWLIVVPFSGVLACSYVLARVPGVASRYSAIGAVSIGVLPAHDVSAVNKEKLVVRIFYVLTGLVVWLLLAFVLFKAWMPFYSFTRARVGVIEANYHARVSASEALKKRDDMVAHVGFVNSIMTACAIDDEGFIRGMGLCSKITLDPSIPSDVALIGVIDARRRDSNLAVRIMAERVWLNSVLLIKPTN